jgi:hypothetical protein
VVVFTSASEDSFKRYGASIRITTDGLGHTERRDAEDRMKEIRYRCAAVVDEIRSKER